MKVTLMGKQRISSVILPREVRGQYKIEQMQKDAGIREVHIEAKEDRWIIKSGENLVFSGMERNEKAEKSFLLLEENQVYPILFYPDMEQALILVEPEDSGSSFYTKYRISENGRILIGNTDDAQVRYESPVIDRTFLISLTCNGQEMIIRDEMLHTGHRAGNLYLNGKYMEQAIVHYGDLLYFFGLKVIFGRNFICINNPGKFVQCTLQPFLFPVSGTQKKKTKAPFYGEETYFSSSPKKDRKIKVEELVIQNPPTIEKEDETPLYLVIGPALTMASASAVTGAFSILTALQNNGNMMQTIPSLVMMGSVMMGSVLCPVFSRRYHARKRKKQNAQHYSRYYQYLKEEHQKIGGLMQQQAGKLRANYPTLTQCENRISGREPSLWERSIGDYDFLELAIGSGSDKIHCNIRYPVENLFEAPDDITKLLNEFKKERKMLDQVPITFSLKENLLTGVTGRRKLVKSFVYGLILQMAALHSYDDLKVGVIYNPQETEWNSLKWLPHAWSNDRMIRWMANTPEELSGFSSNLELIGSMRSGMSEEELVYEKPHYVLILADQKLAEKSEFIKELYRQRKAAGISLILLYNEQKSLPKTCKQVLKVGEEGIEIQDYRDDDRQEKRADNSMFFPGNPEVFFKSLAGVKLDVVAGKSSLPEQLTLFEMLGIGKPQHMDFMNLWEKSNPTRTLAVPIGVDSEGNRIYLDIHEKAHGPHGLIAGSTGSGKSEFIISYITMLALHFSPQEVAFILIDFKGGGMADVFKHLPHLAGRITNLDGNELNRSLLAIETELERRQLLFKQTSNEQKISNIDIYRYQQLYREGVVKTPLPHLIIISDEFAELKQQQPDFLQQLIRTARIGRSLGVHLILATQKPDGVVDDQIKSNIKFKICLRVQDRMDSVSMIGRPDAAAIRVPGRFYFLVGMNELFEQGQSPFSGAEYEEADVAIQQTDDAVVVFNGLERVSVKPGKEKIHRTSEKQIDVLLNYLSEVCQQNTCQARTLWRAQLPGPKQRKEKNWSDKQSPFVLNPVIGQYDDLRKQEYRPLSLPITEEGNVLIYGAAGSGTLEVFNAMICFMIRQHSPEELQMYLLDYESGALCAFAEAPQVTAVYQGYQEEQIDRMLEVVSNEIVMRKKKFSRYGGNYQNYIRNSGKKLPNLVIFLLNCAVAFANGEGYDRMQKIIQLSREGSQYGLYFVVSAVDDRSVRSQLAANFRQVLVLQQNKEDTYRDILGRTGGMVPAPYLGRGLFKRGSYLYEFQTDILFEESEEPYEEIEKFCREERRKYGLEIQEEETTTCARREVLTEEAFQEEWEEKSCQKIPLGTSSEGEKLCWDLTQSVKHLIVMESAADVRSAEQFTGFIRRICPDTEIWPESSKESRTSMETAGQKVEALYQEVITRGQQGVEARNKGEAIPDFPYKVIVLEDYDGFVRQLEERQYFKLIDMFEKVSPAYHIHLLVMNPLKTMHSPFNTRIWERPVESGIWFGNPANCTQIFQVTEAGVSSLDENAVWIQNGREVRFQLPERSSRHG